MCLYIFQSPDINGLQSELSFLPHSIFRARSSLSSSRITTTSSERRRTSLPPRSERSRSRRHSHPSRSGPRVTRCSRTFQRRHILQEASRASTSSNQAIARPIQVESARHRIITTQASYLCSLVTRLNRTDMERGMEA